MRALQILTLLIAVMALALTPMAAPVKDSAQSADKPVTPVPQTNCIVMGDKIDSSKYVDLQGQRIYLCCKGCEKKLRNDPEKYLKKAAEQGVLFENIQKVCPVTGKPIDKRFYTDYVGRRVYFSDDSCKALFAKDPAGYLKKLGS